MSNNNYEPRAWKILLTRKSPPRSAVGSLRLFQPGPIRGLWAKSPSTGHVCRGAVGIRRFFHDAGGQPSSPIAQVHCPYNREFMVRAWLMFSPFYFQKWRLLYLDRRIMCFLARQYPSIKPAGMPYAVHFLLLQTEQPGTCQPSTRIIIIPQKRDSVTATSPTSREMEDGSAKVGSAPTRFSNWICFMTMAWSS